MRKRQMILLVLLSAWLGASPATAVEASPAATFQWRTASHQVVFVVPSLNLIAVRNGGTLGTDTGHHEALRVHDGGQTWEARNEGIANPRSIRDLVAHPENSQVYPDRLYLGTGGNGVFVGEVK